MTSATGGVQAAQTLPTAVPSTGTTNLVMAQQPGKLQAANGTASNPSATNAAQISPDNSAQQLDGADGNGHGAGVPRATDPETGLIAVSSASSLTNSQDANGNNRTLYLGNLHPFVSEQTLQEVFAGLEGITELKVIKDKATGVSAGYGFAKFTEQSYAQVALDRVSKCVLFGQEVRINWAFQKELQEEVAGHFHIFVGDLSADVTDASLHAAFQNCQGCSDARVMWDHATGRSRGYGFVSFRTLQEAEAAIKAMHGQFVGARRVRCGWAQHKTEISNNTADPSLLDRSDPTNTNVYIGNLAPQLTDAEARRQFGTYGPIIEVKLYRKGAYGFIRYKHHEDAIRAIVAMNGQSLLGKQLKCSWGRHPNVPPSGVQNSLMLAAAAGIPPLSLAQAQAQGMMGHGMAPMGMVSGGILGMPLGATNGQGLMNTQGLMHQGHGHHGHGGQVQVMQGANGEGPSLQGGVMSMDPSQLYGMQYGGQVFFSGQQQVQ